jgi:hypothetical protein
MRRRRRRRRRREREETHLPSLKRADATMNLISSRDIRITFDPSNERFSLSCRERLLISFLFSVTDFYCIGRWKGGRGHTHDGLRMLGAG